MRRLSLSLALLAVAGCSLEPRYARPAAPVPPAWPTGEAYAASGDAALPSLAWRDIFLDPALQTLIARGIATNRDLRIAVANVESARAQFRVQRAALLPQVDADAGVTRTHTGPNATGAGGAAGDSTTYSASIGTTAFEIDLFGRVRSLNRSALDQYLASAAGARAARLALVAEIARAYYQLAADRSALAIARQTVASAASSVSLTDSRRAAGIASRMDLAQARTIHAQAEAAAANYTTLAAQDRNALEMLVGAPVADALLPATIEAVDARLGAVPAGLSSTVLLRRPDVVEAEFQLKAAYARIGAARAAFFPRISLTALAGFASPALSALFDGGSFRWSVAPDASLPIFDAGRNAGNLAYAKAQRTLYLAQYEKAIQQAFREVSDALARNGTIGRHLAAEEENVAAAQDNFRLSDARYRAGIDDFLAHLDAQRTLYAARQSLVATRLLRADGIIALYQAIGGDALTDADTLAKEGPTAGLLPPVREKPMVRR